MNKSVCFVGSTGLFSLVALQTLLTQKINVRQIIFSGFAPASRPGTTLPVSSSIVATESSSIPALAEQYKIPIYYVGNNINHFEPWKNFSHNAPPEYVFVACFPFILPAALRQWPDKFAVNLHPSLLPTYRGPDPIFWQLRYGETNTGFSLHLITEALDAGPILLQQAVEFPQGASRDQLDTLLAQQGSEAFGNLLSTSPTKLTEQDPRVASYYSAPQPTDYTLDTNWSAEHAYNFICGTRTPSTGYPILLDSQQYHITSALSFEPLQSLGRHCLQLDQEMLIQFSPGVLRAKAV